MRGRLALGLFLLAGAGSLATTLCCKGTPPRNDGPPAERVPIGAAMEKIQEDFDRVMLAADDRKPADALEPARRMERLYGAVEPEKPEHRASADFAARLREAARLSGEAAGAAAAGDLGALRTARDSLDRACAQCHIQYREEKK
ncbi:MAG: hypothetical protein L0216_00990 [Planctomycetales bacterium]|nr:hypothetical protein [Planctomycetales bacterium]